MQQSRNKAETCNGNIYAGTEKYHARRLKQRLFSGERTGRQKAILRFKLTILEIVQQLNGRCVEY